MGPRRFALLGRRAARYVEGLVRLGADDVILASFPKSGSTWARFVLANLISLEYWDGRALDFPTLNRTLPEWGIGALGDPWPWPGFLPRVVKTHHRAWPVLRDRRSLLLVRDPRDVVVSYYHHDQAQGGFRVPSGGISAFLRHRRHGVPGWVRHTRSWMKAGARVVKYETLRADPPGGFGDLLAWLGASVDPARLAAAIQRSSLEATRAAQKRGGADPQRPFEAGFRFARQGTSGGWRSELDAADQVWVATVLADSGLGLYAP